MNFIDKPISISGVGVVIFAPFIMPLFDKLELIQNNKFKDNVNKIRAVYALHYAVNGEEITEQNQLLIFKILCDLPIETEFDKEIKLSNSEKQILDIMLDAIISQWSILGRTSKEGLRDSFLKRDGTLVEIKNEYNLTIERKSYDILLDHITWNISILKLPWMDKPLTVKW